ncbi:MAG: type IV secretion system protein VirB9 [Candidatus Xenolissoclinum pacificiensis L6]|uniref:Type IV secretion system protein VirB9 n=1 Tax=Candidatus Xenolissoclinum pacificiensis L6 TaxID=1401685 RepID=W2UZ65_9RICK|nr:MAG: type IV secretion system protein VirB9 [Candidatus Xenolissoclinum pacificiensis L6]
MIKKIFYNIQIFYLLISALLFAPFVGYTVQISTQNNVVDFRDIATTSHIKVIPYKEDVIYHYVGYYGIATTVSFDKDEQIVSLIMGNTTGWDIHNLGDRLLLKPILDEDIANTNAILLTQKQVYNETIRRTYHIILSASDVDDIEDPKVPYEIRFIYNNHQGAESSRYEDLITKNSNKNALSETVNVLDGILPFDQIISLNFEYEIYGMQYISPLRIFDDGLATYFKFRPNNATIPAIFAVDVYGNEELINYHVNGDYVIVESVVPKFTLRHGDDYVCVFNNNIAYETPQKKKNDARGG